MSTPKVFYLVRNIKERQAIPDCPGGFRNVTIGTEEIAVEVTVHIDRLLSEFSTIGSKLRNGAKRATMGQGAIVAKVLNARTLTAKEV